MISQSVSLADMQICTFPRMIIRERFGAANMQLNNKKWMPHMKKPSSKIKEEIARLQDQLRRAETREAERIGRVALKAGFGEIEVDEAALQAALEEIAVRFRKGSDAALGRKNGTDSKVASDKVSTISTGQAAGEAGEA